MEENEGREPTYRVIAVSDNPSLEPWLEPWRDLAKQSIEPNPFYEPFMLRPALECLAEGIEVHTILVVREGPTPLLCGLVPLERLRTLYGVPVRTYRSWRYRHGFACAPLVRTGHARPVISALLD